MTDQKSENLKQFLNEKLSECQGVIKKYKRKNKIIKVVYHTLIVTSIAASTTAAIISSFTIPPVIIACISCASAITTGISIKFNLEHMKDKLTRKIQELNKIRDALHYVIACNGDITEEKCNNVLSDFRLI